jgi:hypothetical protein
VAKILKEFLTGWFKKTDNYLKISIGAGFSPLFVCNIPMALAKT